MNKPFLIISLKYGLGLGILAWVIWSHWSIRSPDGEEVGIRSVLMRPIHFFPLLLASLLSLAAIVFTILRWFFLVRAQGLPFTLGSAFRLGLLGLYFNTFLPGALGGDLIKAVFVAREQDRRAAALATVLVDRVVGLCGLLWVVAMIGVLFWAVGGLKELAPSNSAVLETAVLGATGLVIGSLCFWSLLGLISEGWAESIALRLASFPWVGVSVASFWQAVWSYRRQGSSVAVALGMSMVIHVGSILAFYAAANAVFPTVDIPSLGAHLLLVPWGMIIKAGFPTPGGIGGAEFAFGEIYTVVDFSFASGVLASLVTRAISWLLALIGYLVFFQIPPTLRASAFDPPP